MFAQKKEVEHIYQNYSNLEFSIKRCTFDLCESSPKIDL
jgi:hypothetical protein